MLNEHRPGVYYLILVGSTALSVFLAMILISEMTGTICAKTEERWVRYEYSGFFQTKIQIETTEENADGKGKVCIAYLKGNLFEPLKNIEKMVNQSKSYEEKNG